MENEMLTGWGAVLSLLWLFIGLTALTIFALIKAIQEWRRDKKWKKQNK